MLGTVRELDIGFSSRSELTDRWIAPSFDAEIGVRQLNRITQEPAVLGGEACIRIMPLTVGMIVGQIGAGQSITDILADNPYLEREDILQARRYAAWRAEERKVILSDA